MVNLEALIAYSALSDPDAFARLYAATRAQAWAICVRLLRQREPAEEAMQDAYLKIWHQAANYRPQLGDARGWLATIVRNTCLDHLRRRRRDEQHRVDDDPDGATPEAVDLRSPEALLEASASAGVEDCMERLELRQRDLLTESYVLGLSHSELAVRRNMPLGSVKTAIRRGLQALRDCLKAEAAW